MYKHTMGTALESNLYCDYASQSSRQLVILYSTFLMKSILLIRNGSGIAFPLSSFIQIDIHIDIPSSIESQTMGTLIFISI